MKTKKISAIFLDVGGVLLTNGWDTASRKKAAEQFNLDYSEMDSRNRLVFDTFEIGKMSLDEYLKWTVFYEPRSFSEKDFKEFMFAQSQPHSEMINYIRQVKQQHALKIGVISNEGRELSLYRFERFGLIEFVDFFIVSSFIHIRKPDLEIYRLALDIGQVLPEQALYIDDRSLFAEVGRTLGIRAIHHTDPRRTAHEVEVLLE